MADNNPFRKQNPFREAPKPYVDPDSVVDIQIPTGPVDYSFKPRPWYDDVASAITGKDTAGMAKDARKFIDYATQYAGDVALGARS